MVVLCYISYFNMISNLIRRLARVYKIVNVNAFKFGFRRLREERVDDRDHSVEPKPRDMRSINGKFKFIFKICL